MLQFNNLRGKYSEKCTSEEETSSGNTSTHPTALLPLIFSGGSFPRAFSHLHTRWPASCVGRGGGRGSGTLPPFGSARARSRWCERLEASSGAGRPRADGKLCWQRRVRPRDCLTARSRHAKSSLLYVRVHVCARVCAWLPFQTPRRVHVREALMKRQTGT